MLILNDLLQRKCGECKACCTSVGVKELGKPFNMACKHLCEKGCGIYGKHPDSCKGYHCGWAIGFGEFSDRPDKLGALFHAMEDEGLWIDVFLLRQGVDTERIAALATAIARVSEAKGVRFIRYDQVMNTDYPINLKDYPGGENVGEGTVWQYEPPDQTVLFLHAPTRKPLDVIS